VIRVPACRVVAPLARALILALLAGSCAPPPVVRLPERGTVMQRYTAARSEREQRAAGVAADLLLWTRIAGQPRPGVSGRITIAAPDAARLVVGAAFGVAIDVAARGDTLEGWVPSRRRAFVFDTTEAATGLAPGAAACRALGGLWQPPGAAWDAAVAADEVWTLRWSERGDSLRMTVTADGRPRDVEWRPSRGDTLTVSYESWTSLAGEPWPNRLAWTEARGAISARARLDRIRVVAIPPAERRAAIPMGASRSSMEEMSSWWEELTGGEE
jgi:hypothetical protein